MPVRAFRSARSAGIPRSNGSARSVRTVAVAAVGLSLLAVSAPATPTPDLRQASVKRPAATPILVGHRGAGGTAPENTVSAFKDGRASGADFIEIDVQLSADGVPFLFHDDTPARTTNVEDVFPGRAADPITSFTWAELQQLDAGSYFDRRFTGERIPHLDDAAAVGTRTTGVYIEIKSPWNSPGIEQLIADELHTNPAWQKLVAADKVQVIGFDEASNRRFAELAPEIQLQQLTGAVPRADVLAAWATYVDSVGANYRVVNAEDVARVKAAGLAMSVYTVNSPEAVQAVTDLGVDAVTTDFPIESSRHLRGLPVFPGATIEISGAVNDPLGNDVQPETGEYVALRNASGTAVDVSGYFLRDAANNILVVGDGYVLQPGGELRVYTGPGTNSASAYYNGQGASLLNNTGDSLGLWTPDLRLVDVFAN
ncbi:glycerophosphodiester phosphodiesterase family protein [Arthrobacter sp. B1805]|uniref:glycerophosphodiester phosphodiesterase family protein n=1 Tax=Arthrobacter sp. B1805 TaxID=2058892 RepID=UPI000CE32731|nr:glycerophosphodiester phosphodiesterase family protein [Arthrobacter sp. B1805]